MKKRGKTERYPGGGTVFCIKKESGPQAALPGSDECRNYFSVKAGQSSTEVGTVN